MLKKKKHRGDITELYPRNRKPHPLKPRRLSWNIVRSSKLYRVLSLPSLLFKVSLHHRLSLLKERGIPKSKLSEGKHLAINIDVNLEAFTERSAHTNSLKGTPVDLEALRPHLLHNPLLPLYGRWRLT